MDEGRAITAEIVPGVQELFTHAALSRLVGDRALRKMVFSLREQEKRLLDLLNRADAPDVRQACRAFIAQMPDIPGMQPRDVRETARICQLMCEGPLFVPLDVAGFRKLRELAMEGENVRQGCFAPEGCARELTLLLSLLAHNNMLQEIKALCGFAFLGRIRPFADDSGQTGRMLMFGVLSRIYSLPVIICFSSKLVTEKERIVRQFSLLKTGEGSLNEFCAGMLSVLADAQREAIRLCDTSVTSSLI